jgi:hypothetical protein
VGWLTGWSYAKSHVLTPATGAGSGYQVQLRIFPGAGTDSGTDVYLNNHCTNFPIDIAITDDDGTTELYHSYEDAGATPVICWVKVNDSLESSNATICIYYGKSGGSSSYLDGDNTFLFYDHFPGTSLDLSKWSGDTSYASVADSIMTFATSLVWKAMAGTSVGAISCALRARGSLSGSGMFGMAANYSACAYSWGGSSPYIQTAATYSSNWTCNAYILVDILIRYATNARFFQAGSERLNSPRTDSISSGNVAAQVSNYNMNTKLDWIAIRKFTSSGTEPGHSTWSSEQTPPTAGARSIGIIIG